MNSDLAKVLHPLAGRTLLDHVLSTAARLPVEKIAVIVGHQHERVRSTHAGRDVEFILQEPQRGTGHAVQQAEAFLRGHEGSTLILYGDVPLLRRSTLLELMEEHRHSGDAVTVLTARVGDPSGYGRIVRDARGRMAAIVEDRDLEPAQKAIDEINSGIYAYRTGSLLDSLCGLKDDNRQKELYLTDTVLLLRQRGLGVGTYTLVDPLEISGINTLEQLSGAGAVLEARVQNGTEDCAVCAMAEGPGVFPVLLRGECSFLAVAPQPYNSGQLTAHPLRHMLRHADLDGREREDLWGVARAAASAVHEIYGPQGMTIGYGAGRPGEHLALQIIPRWSGDTNFMPLLAETRLLPELLRRTFERVRGRLNAEGRS
jgi:bifunctional UDP-N-acetylglucosamine pyrophosphorylase/glucosamine-1-phosphate N-acetyltransferase